MSKENYDKNINGHIEKFFKEIINWFQKNGRNFAWRKPDCSAYEILISEILLRRTMANRVQEVFIELVRRYPNSKKLSEAEPKEIINIISTLGLHNRYKILIEAAKYLNRSTNITFNSLRNIKGVGNYIAGAFCIFYFGKNIPIIDSNIKRIFNRYFQISSKNEIVKILKIVPKQRIREFYYGIIDLGALICKFKPKCNICPLFESCLYHKI
ncbi:MAG: hypothetical protein ACTSRP_21845 [Candidatus Helarchaeota archaeon]